MSSGLTPISLAGSCLTPRYETISLLLANKANPNVASPAGVTPLMDVCGRAYEPETEKLCNLLLMNEAKATATDLKGRDATGTSRRLTLSVIIFKLGIKFTSQGKILKENI